MPHSEQLKGHVTYDTIALYFVESSLITKSIWERSIYPVFFALSLCLSLSTDYLANSLHVRSRSIISISMANNGLTNKFICTSRFAPTHTY